MKKFRPNILWYCTDQQRFDTIGALGNSYIHTPTLDRLTEQGVAFTHAYCQHPICAPSRASFMTGRYPSSVHVYFNGNDYFPKESERTLVSRLLAENGYDCGLVGKLHLAGCRTRREPRADDGFRYFQWSHTPKDFWKQGEHDYADWLREKGYEPSEVLKIDSNYLHDVFEPTLENDNVPVELHQTTWCTEKAVEFIDTAKSPWMLCVNPFDPHPPFDPPYEYYKRYNPLDMPQPNFRESDIGQQNRIKDLGIPFQTDAKNPSEFNNRSMRAAYYAMIELVDYQFGRIINYLNDKGMLENTVIIFTSDHGEMLGDHGLVGKGGRFYEGAVRVPLIWSCPMLFKSGLRNNDLVELTDIAPTLLQLADIPIPELMQGKSLLSILNGTDQTDKHRSYVRSEYFSPTESPTKAAHATMYRDERWKLIAYHVGDSKNDYGELYDLKLDPWEYNNLWDEQDYSDIKMRLLNRSFSAYVTATDMYPPRTMDF